MFADKNLRAITMNQTTCASLNKHDVRIIASDNVLVVVVVVVSAITAFTVGANFTVIAALIRVRFKRFTPRPSGSNRNTQLLMLSMAVSDAMLGCFAMPLSVYNIAKNRRWELGHDLCNAREIIDIILTGVSFLHVACMALDRYLAVCKPLLFRTLTFKSNLIMIGICWVLPSTFITIVTFSGWHHIGIEDIVLCSRYQKICVFTHNKAFLFVTVLVLIDIPLVMTLILYFLVLREVASYHKRKPKSKHQSETHVLQTRETNTLIIAKGNTSHLHIKANDDGTSFTSQNSRKISFLRGFPNRLVSCGCCKCTRVPKRERSDKINYWNKLLGNSQAEQVNLDFNIQRCETLCSPCNPETIDSKSNNFVHTNFMTSKTAKDTSPRIGQRNVNVSSTQNKHLVSGKSAARLNVKAVTTIGIIVACFTVCYLPLNIAVIVAVYIEFTNPIVSVFVLWLAYVNSILNPFIYCCQRNIRNAVMSLLCPCRT